MSNAVIIVLCGLIVSIAIIVAGHIYLYRRAARALDKLYGADK